MQSNSASTTCPLPLTQEAADARILRPESQGSSRKPTTQSRHGLVCWAAGDDAVAGQPPRPRDSGETDSRFGCLAQCGRPPCSRGLADSAAPSKRLRRSPPLSFGAVSALEEPGSLAVVDGSG